MAFINGLFRGLDFRRLETTPTIFDFSSMLYATIVMMAWAAIGRRRT